MTEATSGGARRARVGVVGSANVDLSIPVEHLPVPGETVLGGAVLQGGGGKGANQAVAAARLGADVAFVGRLGDDDAGRWLRERLDAEGLDLRGLLATPEVTTGLAVITVDADGENSIVVSPGANGAVAAADVEAAASVLADADVVLAQLEIPVPAVEAIAAAVPGRMILNPAPARGDVSLAGVDIVVPNRVELALLADGVETTDPAATAEQARSLDVPLVIVTLGGQGAMAVFNERAGTAAADVVMLPAASVEAVDTTAAGDSFCGALAVALAEGADEVAAMAWAIRVAGQTVTVRGAQDSLPHRSAIGDWASS
ncbi:MAG: ribokinase [Actinomycetota bacterium]